VKTFALSLSALANLPLRIRIVEALMRLNPPRVDLPAH
jgi:hypothetical protein